MRSPHTLVIGSLIAVCIGLLCAVPPAAPVPTGPMLCVLPGPTDLAVRSSGEPRRFMPAYIASIVPAECPSGTVLAYIPAASRK